MARALAHATGGSCRSPLPLLPALTGCALHMSFSGTVVHTRRTPKAHAFSYAVRYDYVNVDVGLRRWWGGLRRSDHFGDPNVPLAEEVRPPSLSLWHSSSSKRDACAP